MADFLEGKSESPKPVSLIQDGVLKEMLGSGAEVILFRSGIEEHRGQILLDGLTDVNISITNLPGKDPAENIRFNVSLQDAQKIVAIRDELRKAH